MGPLRLLLDSHTFYWWCIDSPSMSATARAAIADRQNEKFVSAITAWEIVTKFRSGTEPGFAGIAADIRGGVQAQGFTDLAIAMRHAEIAANLPLHHKDPVDRFIIAQAMAEDMTIVTADTAYPSYSAKLLW